MLTAKQFLSLNPKRNKYGSVRTKRKELTFHSKREAAYYDELLKQKEAGEISYFLMQVPFLLPGNRKYLLDFMVVTQNSAGYCYVDYIDVKGFMTPMSKMKIDQVEDIYKIKIRIIK